MDGRCLWSQKGETFCELVTNADDENLYIKSEALFGPLVGCVDAIPQSSREICMSLPETSQDDRDPPVHATLAKAQSLP